MNIQALSLNVRSLIDIQKRRLMACYIELLRPEIVFIQETWHKQETPLEVTGYYCFISPPNNARSKGVHTLVSDKFQQV